MAGVGMFSDIGGCMDGIGYRLGRVVGSLLRRARGGVGFALLGVTLFLVSGSAAYATDSPITIPDPGFDLTATITALVTTIFPYIGAAIGLALLVWAVRLGVRFLKGIVR